MNKRVKPTLMLLRKRAGLTQVGLAAKIGRSPSTIAKWESGEKIPHLTPIETKTFCEVCLCTLDELVEAFQGKSVSDAANTTNALTDIS